MTNPAVSEEMATKRKFAIGQRVSKVSGSSWTGRVVGVYETGLTPIGYCVESENEPGSVQIYPEAALSALPLPVEGVEPLSSQIDRLGKFIIAEVPGEPSQSDGAVDTAIRWMRSRLTTPAAGPSAVAVKALDKLLNACIREFGWQPDAPSEEPCGTDAECEITWGILHDAQVALSTLAPSAAASSGRTTFGPQFFVDVGRDPAKWVAALRVRLGTDIPTDDVLRDFFGAALASPSAEAAKPVAWDVCDKNGNTVVGNYRSNHQAEAHAAYWRECGVEYVVKPLYYALSQPQGELRESLETVYVVGGTVGEWSDRSEWTVGVWVNEADAEAFVERLGALGRIYEKVSQVCFGSDRSEAAVIKAEADCKALDIGWSDYCGEAPRYTCWPEKLVRAAIAGRTAG